MFQTVVFYDAVNQQGLLNLYSDEDFYFFSNDFKPKADGILPIRFNKKSHFKALLILADENSQKQIQPQRALGDGKYELSYCLFDETMPDYESFYVTVQVTDDNKNGTVSFVKYEQMASVIERFLNKRLAQVIEERTPKHEDDKENTWQYVLGFLAMLGALILFANLSSNKDEQKSQTQNQAITSEQALKEARDFKNSLTNTLTGSEHKKAPEPILTKEQMTSENLNAYNAYITDEVRQKVLADMGVNLDELESLNNCVIE